MMTERNGMCFCIGLVVNVEILIIDGREIL